MTEIETSKAATIKDRSTVWLAVILCSFLAVGLVLLGAAASFAAASPLPVITELAPGYGPSSGGTSVTIRGTNLAEATAVEFGSSDAASYEVNSETEITAVSPAGQGVVPVTVAAPAGASSESAGGFFSYAPIVKTVQPNHGPKAGGTQVTITGSNFTGATAVSFAGREAPGFTVDSDTSITAVSPPVGAEGGIGYVAVTSPGGTSDIGNPNDSFAYGPIVAEMTPSQGPAVGGASVTLTGFGLEGATAVNFGSSPAASFSENSDGSITADAPPVAAGASVVSVTVITPDGMSITPYVPDTEPANFFTYGPTVTSVEPSSGSASGGTLVTIRGSGFTSSVFRGLGGPFVHAVAFGQNELRCSVPWPSWLATCAPVAFEVKSDTEITAVVPAGSGAVSVKVTTDGGPSPLSPSDLFTYTSADRAPESESGGMVQLLSCRSVKRPAAKSGRYRRRTGGAAAQICTSKLVSGLVRARPVAARLLRGDKLYATGTAMINRANTRLELEPLTRVTPGRYRLTLTYQRHLRHEAIAIR